MSCSSLSRSPPVVSLPSSVQGTDAGLVSIVQQSINQGFNQLLQMHNKFTETQEQAIHSHLQALAVEQANLRTLLESLHAKMLQKLDENHEVLARHQTALDSPEDCLLQDCVARPMMQRTLVGGLPNKGACDSADTEDEFLDIRKLPLHWPSPESRKKDAASNDRSFWGRVRRFMRSPKIDIIMSVVLCLNLVSMFIEMEWRSYKLAMLMGERHNDNGFAEAQDFFKRLELVFSSLFFLEVLLRVLVDRCRYFRQLLHIFDAVVVCWSFATMCLLQPTGLVEDSPKVLVARLLMLTRLVKFLRVIHFGQSSTELRVLVRALITSFQGLVWSFLLLGGVIIGSGIFLFQISAVYVEDRSHPMSNRQWAYENFGSATLSILAMWEATFTGSWFRFSRRMIMDVNGYTAIFWIVYVLSINFGTMRLIGALFLKQTLAVAASDREKLTMIKLKEKQKFAHMIREVFMEADKSGDGKISPREFEEMLNDVHVGQCFEHLELEVAEVATLFQLLASDDGQADYEEFLEGALKLKSSAKTIDVIQLMHLNQTTHKKLGMIYDAVCNMAMFIGKKHKKA